MKTIAILLAVLGVTLPLLRAEESSIEDCPSIGWHFKIAPYLSLAKSLQDDGKEKALHRLRSWADSGKHEDQVVVLCRMLFESKKRGEFRRPRIGGAAFLGGTDYPDWPLEPVDLYEGVPILIAYGYVLGGVRESSGRYLDFCVSNCNWRQDRYSVRSAEELKRIVARWLTERQWPTPLSDRDRAFFLDQAEQVGAAKRGG